jgi:hypothetical protein
MNFKINETGNGPDGAFILIEADNGEAFIFYETTNGYFVFSLCNDWSKVVEVNRFVRAMFEQAQARKQSPTNGGALSETVRRL